MYPFPNFDSVTPEVWGRKMITYPIPNCGFDDTSKDRI